MDTLHSAALGLGVALQPINLFFCFVDVRDVARVHVQALEGADVEGRFIMPGHSTSMLGLARLMRKVVSDTKAPVRAIPDWMLYVAAPFSPQLSLRYLRRHLGVEFLFDDSRLRAQFGSCYRPLEESVVDSVRSLRSIVRAQSPS